jgi:hypothetical protein
MSCVPTSGGCRPTDKCPSYAEYEAEPEKWFCDTIGCVYFVRAPEYDCGSRRRNDALMAFICEKDCMDPEIVREEPEPVMPWE